MANNLDPRIEAADEISSRIVCDGSSADDILKSAALYLSDAGLYKTEHHRYGSSVELVWEDPEREPSEDADAWSGGFADNH